MNGYAFLRPLWAGSPRQRFEAWLLLLWLVLLIWSVPFAIQQVAEWRRGVPDEYLNQHARLALGSINGIVIPVAGILIILRRVGIALVFVAASFALLIWSKSLN